MKWKASRATGRERCNIDCGTYPYDARIRAALRHFCAHQGVLHI